MSSAQPAADGTQTPVCPGSLELLCDLRFQVGGHHRGFLKSFKQAVRMLLPVDEIGYVEVEPVMLDNMIFGPFPSPHGKQEFAFCQVVSAKSHNDPSRVQFRAAAYASLPSCHTQTGR